jgi:DNA primase
LVGYAGHGWTTLADALRRDGVTDHELTVMDLAQTTRDNRLIDTLRDRIIVPVRDADHRIRGFIGRDISGDPRAPKYRNPTHTPTFDKSQILYRPTQHALNPGGTVVIVEGVLDALAIAAAAAAADRSRQLAPCAANGVTVTAAQVSHVLGLSREAHCVIALDGDQAGYDGTTRWLQALTMSHGKVAYLTPLPAGTDPADWLRTHPHDGLNAFYYDRTVASLAKVAPYLDARRLTRLAVGVDLSGVSAISGVGAVSDAGETSERVANAGRHLIPLVEQLPTTVARWLLEQSESEMTRLGLNAAGVYTAALHRHPVAQAFLSTPSPAVEPNEDLGVRHFDNCVDQGVEL